MVFVKQCIIDGVMYNVIESENAYEEMQNGELSNIFLYIFNIICLICINFLHCHNLQMLTSINLLKVPLLFFHLPNLVIKKLKFYL